MLNSHPEKWTSFVCYRNLWTCRCVNRKQRKKAREKSVYFIFISKVPPSSFYTSTVNITTRSQSSDATTNQKGIRTSKKSMPATMIWNSFVTSDYSTLIAFTSEPDFQIGSNMKFSCKYNNINIFAWLANFFRFFFLYRVLFDE